MKNLLKDKKVILGIIGALVVVFQNTIGVEAANDILQIVLVTIGGKSLVDIAKVFKLKADNPEAVTMMNQL